jgi:triacylglycerol lipase
MSSSRSFLNNLNAGDETPPGANYGTFYSNCDAIINPDSSVILSGATNTNVGCVAHTSLQSDAGVFSQVLNFVN